MKERILNYAKDPASTLDADIEQWLIQHLNDGQADDVFDGVFRSVPFVEETQGKEKTMDVLSGLIDGARRQRPRTVLLASMAAIIAALAAVSLHLWRETQVPAPKWAAEYASYGQTRNVTLPDNTRIWLHNDSKVVFPDRFSGTRTIFADGEIYAEVNADKKHPFIIDTKGAKVKVLGTTFNLSSYEDNGKVSLTLLKGKVEMEVPVQDRDLHFSLEPGDQITVDRNTGEYSQARIDISSFALWKDSRKFYFMDRPLKEIVLELQEAFDTTIVVKDSRLLSTRYLASFVNNESLEAILGALNCDGKMKITQNDKTYFIYPNN